MTAQQNGTPSADEIERDLAVRRARLASTVDELVVRLGPKEIGRRSVLGVRAKLDAAVRTPEGGVRVERVAAIAAAVLVIVALSAIARRRRR